MHAKPIDLNLFLVFSAIYQTRSVTLAGKRLSMTQSAVSNALKRIREHFGDMLFVRTPQGMVPTPLAERLIGPTQNGLAHFSRAIDSGTVFDAATSDRLFRLAVNDIGQLAMMPLLLEATRARAPGIRLETIDAPYAEARQRMASGKLDLAIGSWKSMGAGFGEQPLFAESFVVLMSVRHALAEAPLDAAAYLAADHIAYSPSGATHAALLDALERAGVSGQRNIVLTAAHSLGLSSMVSASDLLLTAPSRLARAMCAARSDLAVRAFPYDVVPFLIRQQWHERSQGDSGHRWLRELAFGLFHESASRRHGSTLGHEMEVPA